MAFSELIHVFDVDRTLFDGPLTLWALGALATKGVLPTDRRIAEIDALHRIDNEMNYIRTVGRAYPWIVADIPRSILQDTAYELAEHIATEKIYHEITPELAHARAEGHLLLVSNGPDLFVRALGERLGATGTIGRHIEEFGRPAPDKWQRLVQVSQEQGFHITGKGQNAILTHAYGDAMQDLPLLERAMSESVVVNPETGALRQKAHQKGWRIIDCEKCLGKFGDLSQRLIVS